MKELIRQVQLKTWSLCLVIFVNQKSKHILVNQCNWYFMCLYPVICEVLVPNTWRQIILDDNALTELSQAHKFFWFTKIPGIPRGVSEQILAHLILLFFLTIPPSRVSLWREKTVWRPLNTLCTSYTFKWQVDLLCNWLAWFPVH